LWFLASEKGRYGNTVSFLGCGNALKGMKQARGEVLVSTGTVELSVKRFANAMRLE
jgi:hypothetical protein